MSNEEMHAKCERLKDYVIKQDEFIKKQNVRYFLC